MSRSVTHCRGNDRTVCSCHFSTALSALRGGACALMRVCSPSQNGPVLQAPRRRRVRRRQDVSPPPLCRSQHTHPSPSLHHTHAPTHLISPSPFLPRRTTSSARPTCPPSASTLFVSPHFPAPTIPSCSHAHARLPRTENEDAHARGPPRQAPDRLPLLCSPRTTAPAGHSEKRTHTPRHSGTRRARSGSTR